MHESLSIQFLHHMCLAHFQRESMTKAVITTDDNGDPVQVLCGTRPADSCHLA